MNDLIFDSPAGRLRLSEEAGAITRLEWTRAGAGGTPSPLLREARAQIASYFAGRRRAFDLPLAPHGTAFQKQVWQALSAIPYGATVSYGEIARRIGARAARPVGTACGANPIPILIPCHRVLSATGALTGYSGRGGLKTKAALLTLEQGGRGIGQAA